MQTRKKLCALLAVVLCMGLALPVHATGIDEAKQKAQELENKKQTAEGEKADLNKQLADVVAKMQDTEKKITEKEAEINKKAAELIQAKNDENDQYESMKKRIRYMYENGNAQFLEILCKSRNITDFLNNAEYISTISKYDRNMLKEFQNIVKKVEKQEKELQDQYAEIEKLQKELESNKNALTVLVANKEVEISSLDGELGDAKAKVAELEAAAAEAERKRQEMLATPTSVTAPQVTTKISGNATFSHPCPDYTCVSSDYGYRVQPLPGATSRHDGVDFAAPTGTPVYAVEAGTVTHVGWFGTGGQAVIINHGNGMVTWYLHLSAYSVKQGQQVSRGENVGYVGTTGNSTGPHLHFQVNINGTPVSPWNFLNR